MACNALRTAQEQYDFGKLTDKLLDVIEHPVAVGEENNMQFIDLKAQYAGLKDEIDANIQAVLDSAQFIGGPQVKQLEGGSRGLRGPEALHHLRQRHRTPRRSPSWWLAGSGDAGLART